MSKIDVDSRRALGMYSKIVVPEDMVSRLNEVYRPDRVTRQDEIVDLDVVFDAWTGQEHLVPTTIVRIELGTDDKYVVERRFCDVVHLLHFETVRDLRACKLDWPPSVVVMWRAWVWLLRPRTRKDVMYMETVTHETTYDATTHETTTHETTSYETFRLDQRRLCGWRRPVAMLVESAVYGAVVGAVTCGLWALIRVLLVREKRRTASTFGLMTRFAMGYYAIVSTCLIGFETISGLRLSGRRHPIGGTIRVLLNWTAYGFAFGVVVDVVTSPRAR